jgi:hypothetical protein
MSLEVIPLSYFVFNNMATAQAFEVGTILPIFNFES